VRRMMLRRSEAVKTVWRIIRAHEQPPRRGSFAAFQSAKFPWWRLGGWQPRAGRRRARGAEARIERRRGPLPQGLRLGRGHRFLSG